MVVNMNENRNENKNRAEATAYILYMIIGSYFHKCICKTHWLEKRTANSYRHLPVSMQEAIEQKAIRHFESLMEYSLDQISEMNSEVFIKKRPNGEYQLEFQTSFEKIDVMVDREGAYQIVFYERKIPAAELFQVA